MKILLVLVLLNTLASPTIFMMFSTSLSGSNDFVLLSSLDGFSNFAHKFNSKLWMET